MIKLKTQEGKLKTQEVSGAGRRGWGTGNTLRAINFHLPIDTPKPQTNGFPFTICTVYDKINSSQRDPFFPLPCYSLDWLPPRTQKRIRKRKNGREEGKERKEKEWYAEIK